MTQAREIISLLESVEDFTLKGSFGLFRGLKNVTKKTFKPDFRTEKDNRKYGDGVYFHTEVGYNGALQWIRDKGMVVKFKATEPLLLRRYTDPKDQQDLMKKLPNKYDGIYLSHPNQEAGVQIVLRDRRKLKTVGFWPIDFEFDKYGDPKPIGLLNSKTMKRF